MAGLKRICLFLFPCLLSQCAPSLQACTRPNPGANVILTPDQTSYSAWSYIIFSCPTGYTASAGNTYSYCYPGSPDYWSPSISTVITCTRDTSVTTPATGNITAEAMIFVADPIRSEIYMADVSSDSLDSLTFSSLPLGSVLQPIAVDFDPDTRMVYWTESSGSIRRGNIDGTGQSVIASGLGVPEGLALDTSRGKVFWTDYSLDRIVSANLDGSSQRVLINTDIYKPRAIIVDQEEGVMFWTDWNYPASRIERANLDGGDRYVIVNSSLQWPNGLAFSADEEVLTPTEVYYPTEQPTNEPTQELVTEDNWTPRPTWWWWYTTDQPRTEDSRTPRPTWWWWHTTNQPITDDNRTPRPTWWWWYTTDEPTTDVPTTTPWWWNNPTTTPWWWNNPATTSWWWNNPTTGRWDPTSYPPVGDDGFDCDFDSGLCGWTQDVTDSFNWTMRSGSTPSSNTGPSSDHTTGYGQYIYIETSQGVQGNFARLNSPEVVASRMKCLQFYYHMYGSTIGTLNVYVSKVGDPLGIPVFQIVGNQGNSWNLAQVEVMRADTDRFVVTLEGIRGSSYTGDIAFDDIIMFSGSCSQGQVRLVNGNEPNEGRVEVLYDGVWGTVCDDSWDINDGRVVCRSLGYRDVISAPPYANFGQGSGPIWMDNVHCSGDEEHIFDCPHNGFGSHNCGHNEDASVICASPERELICDSTSMTLLMDRDLLEIGDDARDVHFEDESCVGYDHDSQRVAITTMYDRCNTKQEQEEDNMVFSNVVTYYKPRPENGTSGIITREHYLHIPVTCYLKRERILGESFTPGIDKYTYDEEGYGEFSLSLDRFTNAGFYQHANDSGMVELGTPLYFGVTLNSVTNLTLLIESCWATSSPYPLDDHRYDIIEDGCAVDSTTFIYYTSSPTSERFRVDAFTFIGDYDKVYVHCSILICDYRDTGSRCAQGCLSRARRSLQPTGSRSKPHTITNGPLSDASHFKHTMMVDNDNDGGETHDPLMIVALSALCVLIALTVITSFVVVRMRRRGPEMIGYRRVGVAEDY